MDGAQRIAKGSGNCADGNSDVRESQPRIRGPAGTLHNYFAPRTRPPIKTEKQLLKARLEDAISQREQLNEAHGPHHALTASLEEERNRLDDIISHCTAILRPIHRLPPELLSKIFLLCVVADWESDDSPRNQAPHPLDIRVNPREMPWALAQVCQSWRNHILGTPNLWSFATIGFPVPRRYVETYDRVVQTKNHRLRLQLQRALTRPLTVNIYPPEGHRKDRSIYLLCAQVAKWKDVRVELNNRSAGSLSAIRGLLPSLESLDITWLGCEQEVASFEVAPHLERLVVSGNPFLSNGSTSLRLPFLQITDFRWYNDNTSPPTPVSQHLLLSQLQNLEKCELLLDTRCIEEYHKYSNQQPLIISLLRLQELELVDNRGVSGVHVILSWIRAPSLTKLTISSSGTTRTPFLSFFLHPENLASLTIRNVEMASPEFGAVLAMLTSLTELSFGVDGGITDTYLRLFCGKEAETEKFSAVPRLQNLSLLAIAGIVSSFSEDTLLDMLEARRRKGAPSAASERRLMSVQLGLHLVTKSAQERLDELRAAGLRVRAPVEK
ncbi:hypothetical protein V5O48_004575 [Marasmius crinis-equi]|uniref:F-box domain-containing protein n=1 Tax=Marasmius crinis-equi TaxID=585013 RepID=A0ABR3FQG4_9AGAR